MSKTNFIGVAKRAAVLGVGGVASRQITKLLPTPENANMAKLKPLAAALFGAFIPQFVKGEHALNFANGMVAVGVTDTIHNHNAAIAGAENSFSGDEVAGYIEDAYLQGVEDGVTETIDGVEDYYSVGSDGEYGVYGDDEEYVPVQGIEDFEGVSGSDLADGAFVGEAGFTL